MHINFISNSIAATPIRPLFKGEAKVKKCSEGGNCPDGDDFEIKPEASNIDNKGLASDKFEKTTTIE